ncbi:MAG TPA: hypothetical protein VIL48_11865 [Acidimicrobiales bacterium]
MGDVDRRAVFFLIAAGACALLAPVADGYAWVAIAVTAVYVLLAGASWLDHRSRRQSR